MELLKELLAQDGIAIRGVYGCNDAKVRLRRGWNGTRASWGLPLTPRWRSWRTGVRYFVDVKDGQKTGFFLDQKYNRQAVGRLCRGARVLDCFTHTGSFALNAGICGAEHVIGVDASELGVAQARENGPQRAGGPGGVPLRGCVRPAPRGSREQFDVVILDPPAFTKSAAR